MFTFCENLSNNRTAKWIYIPSFHNSILYVLNKVHWKKYTQEPILCQLHAWLCLTPPLPPSVPRGFILSLADVGFHSSKVKSVAYRILTNCDINVLKRLKLKGDYKIKFYKIYGSFQDKILNILKIQKILSEKNVPQPKIFPYLHTKN